MLDKIQSILKSTEGVAASLVILVGLGLSVAKLSCDKSELQDRNFLLHNKVADSDSLRLVLTDAQNANFELRERHSFLERNNEQLKVNNSSVRKHLAETSSKLLTYMEANSELQLENRDLKGTIRAGTPEGELTVDFAEKTPEYSFDATAFVYPKTYLRIHRFSIYDSTFAGIRYEDGYFIGFIGHSNPLVRDKGASFSYAVEEIMPEYSAFGFRIGVGPAFTPDGITLAGLAGLKYRDWDLAGFVAGRTVGVILSRIF